MSEYVNHPKHYAEVSPVECIDVIRYLPHSLATSVKYVWRFRHKWNPTEDLDKALWYLDDFMLNIHNSLTVDWVEQCFYTATMMDSTGKLQEHINYLKDGTGVLEQSSEIAFFQTLYDGVTKASVTKTEVIHWSIDLLEHVFNIRDHYTDTVDYYKNFLEGME